MMWTSPVRDWLTTRWFPPARSPPPKNNRIAVGGALAIGGIALVLLRSGGAPLDSVLAEDGWIFLGGALAEPFPTPVFTSFAGYLNLLPRLIAEAATLVPLDWAAATIAVASSAVTVLSAFVVWHASSGHLRDPLLRGFMALSVVLVGVVGEQTLANISYLQWVLFMPTFWLLLWRPASTRSAAAGASFLMVSVASTPLALVLVPIAALRIFAVRRTPDVVLVGGFATGALAQLVTILLAESTATAGVWRDELLTAYLVRVTSGVILGHRGSAEFWEAAGNALLIASGVALAILVLAAMRPHAGRPLSLLAIALSVALFLVSGYQRDPLGGLIWEEGESHVGFARYTVVPALLLIVAILVQLQHRPIRIAQATWRRVRLGVLGLLAAAAISSFYVGDDSRPVKWSTEIDAGRERCEMDAELANTEVPVSPPGWTMSIPCSELRR
jgi:hypothetical protein